MRNTAHIVGATRTTKATFKIAPSNIKVNPKTNSNDVDEKHKCDILVWINTYERPDELKELLEGIYKSKKDYNIKLLIFDDFSTKDYSECINKFNGKLNIRYLKLPENHGKKQYWKLCTNAMNFIREYDFKYLVKLDDDLEIVDEFFTRCINLWEAIKDRKKICLNFRLDSREGQTVWTGIKPKKNRYPYGEMYLAQWVDCDFFVQRRFFEELDWKISTIRDARWVENKNKSSGVGQDISKRLVKKKLHLYLTTESLVINEEHESKMNKEERKKNNLLTKNLKNKNYGLKA